MDTVVIVSGASSGIGAALLSHVPWPARLIGISRRPPPDGVAATHLPLDLADPASWTQAAEVFDEAAADAERVVFVHAAGTLVPMGWAGEQDLVAYQQAVLLNSAAPQVLGAAFLAAVRRHQRRGWLVLLSSGAARTPYEGWSHYCAGKAAVDQWVRVVGAEQQRRGGAVVWAVAPGVVETPMQALIRGTDERDFPQRARFEDLHRTGALRSPEEAARGIWSLWDRDLPSGSVVDLRDLDGGGR